MAVTAHKGQFPEFYITSAQPCPYLPGKLERKLFTHLTRDKAPSLIDTLLRGGFRRSQNIAYMPYCDACRGCVSVRVLAQEFAPNRGFRRTLNANQDLIATRVPPVPTTEQYSLFRGYIDARHNDGGMAEMSVLDYATMIEDSAVDTFITEYRLKPDTASPRDNRGRGPLIGVALCDVLSDGISMVYSFYEPELHARSLGTFMVLDHIAHARARGLPYVYLGYWIDGSRKMAYKTRFQPQEHLLARGWVRTEPATADG